MLADSPSTDAFLDAARLEGNDTCSTSFMRVDNMSRLTQGGAGGYNNTRKSIMVRTTLASTVLVADMDGIHQAANFLEEYYVPTTTMGTEIAVDPLLATREGSLERTPARVYETILHYYTTQLATESMPVMPSSTPSTDIPAADHPCCSTFASVLRHPLLENTSAIFLDADELEDEQFMAHFRLIGVLRQLARELNVKPSVTKQDSAIKTGPGTASTEVPVQANTTIASSGMGEEVTCCEAVERYERARQAFEAMESTLHDIVHVLSSEEGSHRVHKIRKLIEPYLRQQQPRRLIRR